MAILLDIAPLNTATGSRVTLRFAGVADSRVTSLNDVRWWPGIISLPTLSMEGWDGDFSGSAIIASASFGIDPIALIKNDPAATGYRWADALVNIYEGEVGAAWGSWTLRFSGRIKDYSTDESGRYAFSASVDGEPFDANVLYQAYAGTGGIEGGADLKTKPKPMLFGRAQNVEPVLINAVDSVYQVHGYGSIAEISAVYERAASLVGNGGTNVGNFATLAELIAATIPAGSFGTCLALGLFRLGAPPAGVITCDVDGENGSGTFVRTTATIIARLSVMMGISSTRLDIDSLSALNAAVPYPINIYQTTQVKFIDLVQLLARPCNAQAIITWTGKLCVVRFGAIPSATTTLDAQGQAKPPVLSMQEVKTSSPYWRIEMRGTRCWRVHTKDEIAFADDLIDLGAYSGSTTYRAGNIVALTNGSRWLYVSTTPSAGNTPQAGSSYWSVYQSSTVVTWATGVTGTGKPDDYADVTSTKTAAAIAGQGALATQNAVNLGTQVSGALPVGNAVAGLVNSNISIGANGTLSGGGGGSVTFGGLGGGALGLLPNLNFGGPYLLEYSGGPEATNANYRTIEGTAAAISGQGALATQGSATWASQVSGRPNELTDGRIASALDASGFLITGVKTASGVGSVSIADLLNGVSGTNLSVNPELRVNSLGGWVVYNNAGGIKVALSIVNDFTAPNASGRVVRVSYDGTGTYYSNPTPGFGGLVKQLVDGGGASSPGYYARGTNIILSLWAKIPAGRSIDFASNSVGNEQTFQWLTPQAGTGTWQLYLYRLGIGVTGSFGTTGYFYILGGPNTAFSWDVAKYDQIDITSSPQTFGALYDDTTNFNALRPGEYGANVTEGRVAASISGQGGLATKSNIGYAEIRPGEVTEDRLVSTTQGKLSNITTNGLLESTYVYKDGVAYLNTVWPQEAGANVTESRVAASIFGQGGLATRSSVGSAQIDDYSVAYSDLTSTAGRFGTNIVRADGATSVTDAVAITSLGVANGFSGQGALATRNSIGSAQIDANSIAYDDLDYTAGRFGANIVRQNGSTSVTDATAITSLGTAASFSGQTGWATLSAPTSKVSFLTSDGRLLLGANNGLANEANNAWLTDANTITINGTAAAISGQGGLATRSSVGSAQIDDYSIAFSDLTSTAGRFGTNIVRADGSTSVTDAAAITSLGTAASFSGQGSLATRNSVGSAQIDDNSVAYSDLTSTAARFGGNVVRADGSTSVTDATAITSLGTASAFSGQTAWATLSAPTAKVSFLTSDGRMLLGTNNGLANSANNAWLTDANTITANGTAAGIASQGALATVNAATWSSQVTGTGKPSDNAGTSLSLTTLIQGDGVVPTVVGNSAAYAGGSSWNSAVISGESFYESGWVSARLSNLSYGMLGLTSLGSPTPYFSQADYAIYATPGSYVYIYESGANAAVVTFTPQASDIVAIHCDGVKARYYIIRGGAMTLLFTSTISPVGKSFRAFLSFAGQTFVDIQFGASSSNQWGAIGGSSKPEDNADVTMIVNGSRSIAVGYSYTGTVKSGQLPLDVPFKLVRGNGSDVTASATWSATLRSGSATFTIGSATGVLNVTAIAADAVIETTALYAGASRKGTLSLVKVTDPPPISGGGSGSGTTANTSTIASTSSTSYSSANTSILTVVAGSAGQVDLTFPGNFYRTDSGTLAARGKWQWRVVGGTFADVATEINSDLSANNNPGDFSNDPGALSVTQTKTGLTNGTSYEFQLLLRNASSGTATWDGTATAVGS